MHSQPHQNLVRAALIAVCGMIFLGAGCASRGVPSRPSSGASPPPSATSSGHAGTVLAGSTAPLLEFVKTDYEAAIRSDKLVVLYFYANWCPECKEEFPKMQSAFGKLATDRVIGFRVNFNDSDTNADETALAREFGVPYQHTKVFLKNGKRLLKSPAGWDEARYLAEIEKSLAQ